MIQSRRIFNSSFMLMKAFSDFSYTWSFDLGLSTLQPLMRSSQKCFHSAFVSFAHVFFLAVSVESSEETLKTCIIDLLVNTKKIVRGSRPLPIPMKKQPSCELRAGAISMDPLQSRIGCSYSFMSDRPRFQLEPNNHSRSYLNKLNYGNNYLIITQQQRKKERK